MDEVVQVQNRFDTAELHADRDVLELLIAEDFQSIGPRGFVLDKRQWIDRHGEFRYHELVTSEMDVRRYGDAAVVRNVQRNHASYGSDEVRLAVRVSQVWIRSEDTWQIVAIQFSPLAEG